jgi:hypothetical protein
MKLKNVQAYPIENVPDYVIEEFKKLSEDHYIPMICEGYGFLGILNDKGECKVLIDDKWVLFDDVINNYDLPF